MKAIKFKETSFNMGNIDVNYRIIDKMINLTDFYKKYNNIHKTNYKISDFLNSFTLFFESLLKNNDSMIHRARTGMYCHPYIFIFACRYIDRSLYNTLEIKNINNINKLFIDHCNEFYPYYFRTVTYAIIDLDTGLVKIGKSDHLTDRIKNLSARWNNISLLFWIGHNAESKMHLIFKDNRSDENGGVEWFRLERHQLNMMYDMSFNKELNNINILNDIYGTKSWDNFENLKNEIPFRETIDR